MRNKSYVEYLDHLIKETEQRLLDLQTARRVVAEISSKVKELVVAPEVQQEPGSITLRRVEAAPPAKKERNKRKGTDLELRGKVLQAINRQPQRSDALIAEFRPGGDKSQKQEVYAALYGLKMSGAIVQAEDRTYHIAGEEPAPRLSAETQPFLKPQASH